MSEPIMVQVDDVVREATSEEVANIRAIEAEQKQLKADAAAALEARKEPLRRLGLSEADINTVLGL